jgi:hypothetical protein
VALALAAHVAAGEAAQLRVDERRQALKRALVAVAPVEEQARHFVRLGCGHARAVSAPGPSGVPARSDESLLIAAWAVNRFLARRP